MKPSEQVYSQVVEGEQFRDTSENNKGGDGEVHHATANCQLCHPHANGKAGSCCLVQLNLG
jgi:hypothetical protein